VEALARKWGPDADAQTGAVPFVQLYGDDNLPINFGSANILSIKADYWSCGVPIHDVGIEFSKSDSFSKPKRILILERLNEAHTGFFGGRCSSFENNINFRVLPHQMFWDIVWKGSYYAVDEHYVIRFDGSMNTYAELVGRQIFLPNGDDLDQLLETRCGRPDELSLKYKCVDQRLTDLTDVVRKFYR